MRSKLLSNLFYILLGRRSRPCLLKNRFVRDSAFRPLPMIRCLVFSMAFSTAIQYFNSSYRKYIMTLDQTGEISQRILLQRLQVAGRGLDSTLPSNVPASLDIFSSIASKPWGAIENVATALTNEGGRIMPSKLYHILQQNNVNKHGILLNGGE